MRHLSASKLDLESMQPIQKKGNQMWSTTLFFKRKVRTFHVVDGEDDAQACLHA